MIKRLHMTKTLKPQRSKAIDIAILKFIKAVEASTTSDEMFNLAHSYKNLIKAILSENSNKNIARRIITDLHSMCLVKIKLIQQQE